MSKKMICIDADCAVAIYHAFNDHTGAALSELITGTLEWNDSVGPIGVFNRQVGEFIKARDREAAEAAEGLAKAVNNLIAAEKDNPFFAFFPSQSLINAFSEQRDREAAEEFEKINDAVKFDPEANVLTIKVDSSMIKYCGENVQMSENQREMPKYRCHKEAYGLKIKSVTPQFIRDSKSPTGVIPDGAVLTFVEEGYSPVYAQQDWFAKFDPQVGQYLVTYIDGYQSVSPGDVFESGYTRID